ncbi:DUF2382 domain-containing protein [Arthrobacter woluwensis]|uniref:DUF2382 domain-containing protein n=1 Tax=Arthrobacter woluwensis TaxID=156980 RepID=UPI00380C9B87
MIDSQNLAALVNDGGNVVDSEGEKIGAIGQIYLDDATSQPTWVTAKTGLFGTSESFVPIDEARQEGRDLLVPYSKAQVKDAPRVEPDGHLEPEDEDKLYSHYGLPGRSPAGNTAEPNPGYPNDPAGQRNTAGQTTVGHDTSGPTTDDAMTRSEERLNVDTRTEEAGKVRLRKYITTENVTTTVPLRREEVRIEREPIDSSTMDKAMDGPELSEEEHEVTLYAERPVVEKETVPVERVRLNKETTTEQHTVNEEIRKENIDMDGDEGQHS